MVLAEFRESALEENRHRNPEEVEATFRTKSTHMGTKYNATFYGRPSIRKAAQERTTTMLHPVVRLVEWPSHGFTFGYSNFICHTRLGTFEGYVHKLEPVLIVDCFDDNFGDLIPDFEELTEIGAIYIRDRWFHHSGHFKKGSSPLGKKFPKMKNICEPRYGSYWMRGSKPVVRKSPQGE